MSKVEMKQITLNFSGVEFTINGIGGVYDLTGFSRQVIDFSQENLILQICRFKSFEDMGQWNRGLSDKAKDFYGIVSKPGRYGGTTCNEKGIYAFSLWVSEDFQFAVMEAFEAAANGDGDKAVKVAKSVVRSELRVEAVNNTKVMASEFGSHVYSRGGSAFGKGPNQGHIREVYNHVNLCVFGKATRTLKEELKELYYSKKKKVDDITLREHLEDKSIARLGAIDNSLFSFMDSLDPDISPVEFVWGCKAHIEKLVEAMGGPIEPIYKAIKKAAK